MNVLCVDLNEKNYTNLKVSVIFQNILVLSTFSIDGKIIIKFA